MNTNKDPNHWRKVQAQRKRYIKECAYCGEAYEALAISHFCSEKCRRANERDAKRRQRRSKFFSAEGDSDID